MKILIPIYAAILLIIGCSAALCVPALDQPFLVSQPDGTTFTAQQGGDEWFNWTRVNDHVVVRDTRGFWNYGRVVSGKLAPSGARVGIDTIPAGAATHKDLPAVAASRSAERAAATGEAPSGGTPTSSLSPALAPSTPTEPLLVILVSFTDRTIAYSASTWATTMFGTSGRTVRTYYDEVSNNGFHFDPASETQGTANDGIVAVTLNRVHPNTASTVDDRNQQIVKDALIAADGDVNFALFDTNGNGRLSSSELHVLTIVAGYEYSYGGSPTPSVWAHRWALQSPVLAPTLDGKTLCSSSYGGSYVQAGESHSSHQATIGVMCHELGHDIGLPDLYDTDGSSYGVGGFCLMAAGSWGTISGQSAGAYPVHMSAWCKIKMGFATPTLVTGSSYMEAPPSTSYNILKFSTTRPTEYFLLENRQTTGFDAGLYNFFKVYPGDGSGGGLALWHIDDSQTSNSNEARKWVDLEEANEVAAGKKELDLKTNQGRKAHLFYSGGNTHFGDTTTPNTKYYDLTSSGGDVSSISAVSGVMSCYVCPGPVPTISSITPNIGGNGGTISIASIAGGPFALGATVKLTKSGQADINATNVVANSTSVSCDFNLTGAAAGRWNVVVTNPCATAAGTLTNGFDVATNGTARVYSFDMSANPGWTVAGQWAFGQPLGGGGVTYPYPDPTSGFTGSNVYGVNLSGNYSTSTGSALYLTTSSLNLAGITGTELRFWRWLNSDAQPKVQQTVDVSNNGSTWSNLWSNSTTALSTNVWSQQAYSISATADNRSAVWVRWGHRIAASGAKAYSGWNIDDVEFWGTASATGLAHAKALADQSVVRLVGVTTTTATSTYPGEVFVQDGEESGVRVVTTGSAAVGRLVDVVGRITQSSGDCYINAIYITDRGVATPKAPAISAKSLGGASAGLQQGITNGVGANNTGMLVRVTGKVQSINSTSFYIKDGSKANGVPLLLKVTLPAGLGVPANNAYVAVKGISCREYSAGVWVPILRAQGPGYYQTLKNP